MSLATTDAVLELFGIVYAKFDLFLDIQYVSNTEISTKFIKWLLIVSILLPYIYIVFGTFCHHCHEIVPRVFYGFFGLSHYIEVPYF
jgi:hypothetical protein